MKDDRPDLRGLRVLVAEDNRASREVVCTMLETMGAVAIGAADGLAALEEVRQARPDLILLDLEMPEMSGLDVLQVLASEPDAPPVICLTGHAEPEFVTRVTDLGAAGLLAKPIRKIEALGQRVLHAVEPSARLGAVSLRPDRREALDLKTFGPLAEMMGPEMIRKVLAQMETDIGTQISEMNTAVRDADFAKARGAAHVLVSVAGSVGARQLLIQARAVSTAAQQLDHVALGGAVAPLRAQLDTLIEAISAEIERH